MSLSLCVLVIGAWLSLSSSRATTDSASRRLLQEALLAEDPAAIARAVQSAKAELGDEAGAERRGKTGAGGC
jgi:hypothetical protein